MDWIVARYASFDVLNAEARAYVSEDGVAAAQRALRCGPLRRLLSAVDAPLTFGRFLSNLTSSFALTTLRFPSDPTSAARSLCHSRRAHRAAAS